MCLMLVQGLATRGAKCADEITWGDDYPDAVCILFPVVGDTQFYMG